ncbi:MAG: helix-turn-helix domain-containing protein [Solirubrobacteraceae bacterium]|nr:helix-turn-helix domain-containing protein [Patulibacter sp.]
MLDPESPPTHWRALDADAKRARLLGIAEQLFAREGIDFPVPELARSAGIGVGSIYRLFGSKSDLLAELVVKRIEAFQQIYDDAAGSDDPVGALRRVIDHALDLLMQDQIAQISLEVALDHPHVQEARQRAADALGRLVEESKAAGGLRPDARTMDLRMAFRAAREAERLVPGGGRRLCTLVVDGLHRH